MSDSPVTKVPYHGAPGQCVAMAAGNQCLNLAVDGGTTCMLHGGNRQLDVQRVASLKNYHLTQWRAKLARHAGSSDIKSLREEIGILRMVLETRLNQCANETDLMIQSGAIADLVMKIDKTVSSCHKLEGSLGELLDKTSILQFAGEMIGLLEAELSDQPDVMRRLAQQITEVVGRMGNDDQ